MTERRFLRIGCVQAVCALAFAAGCARATSLPIDSDPPAELIDGWEYSFDPGASATDPPGAPGWNRWRLGAPIPDRAGRDTAWFHRRLPAGRWPSPTLFIHGVDSRMEAFADGAPLEVRAAHVHRSGPIPEWLLIGLPAPVAGSLLALHITSENTLDLGPYGRVAVGRFGDFIVSMVVADAGPTLVGVFALSVAGIALVLFLRRREDRGYLAFAAWAAALGVMDLSLTDTKQLLWNAPWFWERALPLARLGGSLALWATAHHLFGSGPQWRRAFRAVALVSAAVAAAIVIDVERVYRTIWLALNLQWAVGMGAVLAIVARPWLRGDREASLFLAALFADAIAVVHDTLMALHRIGPGATWSDTGQLVLIAAIGAIVLGRLGAVYAALTAHARELETTNERLRAAEADLTEAVKARDDFLSVASHELRTPLTSLQLQIQLLHRGKRDSPAALEVAERQAHRLGKLIETLLDVSRVRGGSLSLQREPTDASALAREVAAREQAEASRAGSPLVVDAPEPLLGNWDRAALDQVVSNLLANAVKYGGGKPIHLRARREGGSAVLLVQDQGIGIAPEDQQRIFERFERASSSRNYAGLGLGLWIAREIVAAHGGRMSVQSARGAGATFRVELPL